MNIKVKKKTNIRRSWMKSITLTLKKTQWKRKLNVPKWSAHEQEKR